MKFSTLCNHTDEVHEVNQNKTYKISKGPDSVKVIDRASWEYLGSVFKAISNFKKCLLDKIGPFRFKIFPTTKIVIFMPIEHLGN